MKRIVPFILTFLSVIYIYAQDNKFTEIYILTSARCGMCKEKIETAMAYEKGVKEFNLDLNTKKLKVIYDENKTNAVKIRKAISKLGYDADSVKADPKAYKKLPACCKINEPKSSDTLHGD